jgi:hypothetical protein
MIRRLILLICLAGLTACAHLPRINPIPPGCPTPNVSACRDLFPHGRWQLYHSIEATLPDGRKSVLTGVTVLSSEDRSIRWALMTVEGFVLFSGRWDENTLTVDRAVPPFNRPGFAQGLMDDLRLLLFAPQDPLIATGRLEKGDPVCRFGSPENTIDIAMEPDGSRIVRQYGSNRRLVRSVVAHGWNPVANGLFARHLILKHHGILGYMLKLKLINAIPIDKESGN